MWLVKVTLEEKHSVPGPGAGKGWHAGLLQWYCVGWQAWGGLDSRVRTMLDCASTRGKEQETWTAPRIVRPEKQRVKCGG